MNDVTKPKRTLKELFDESLKLWGLGSQLTMFAEEAGEAIVAALHVKRANRKGAVSLAEFAEELTDNQFMAEEMIYYLKEKTVCLTDKQIEKIAEAGVLLSYRELKFFDAMILFRQIKEKRLDALLDSEVGPTDRGL